MVVGQAGVPTETAPTHVVEARNIDTEDVLTLHQRMVDILVQGYHRTYHYAIDRDVKVLYFEF